MIYVAPGASFEAVADGFATGLVGTIGVRLIDNAGGTTIARTTAGIIETPAGSGVYAATLTAPSSGGQYTVVWDDGTRFATEELVVTYSTPAGAVPGTVDYVSLGEAKAQLEISGTGRDNAIAAAITAASRALNRRAERELTPKTASAVRTFRVPVDCYSQAGRVSLAPYDLRSATLVRLHPEQASPQTLTVTTQYTLWPIGAAQPTNTYTAIRLAADLLVSSTFATRYGSAQLEVTGAWGAWDTGDVPEDIKRACIVTVGTWIDRAVAEYGDDALNDPRIMHPGAFGSYGIPPAAYSLLVAAGIITKVLVA